MFKIFRAAAGVLLFAIAVWTIANPSLSRSAATITEPSEPHISTGASRLTDEDRSFLKDLAALTRQQLDDLSEDERQALELKVASVSARLPDITSEEDPPIGSGTLLFRGEITGPDAFHSAQGTVAIARMKATGQIIARVSHLTMDKAPLLRVILSSDTEGDPTNHPIVLGTLKGNLGSANFDVPKNVNLSTVRSLTIVFPPFGTRFAVATLH